MNKSLSNVFTAGQIQSSLYCANHKSVNWQMARLFMQHYSIPRLTFNYTINAIQRQETYSFLHALSDASFTLFNHFQLQEPLKVLWSTVIPTEENKYLTSE